MTTLSAEMLEFRNPPVQEAVLEIRFSPNPKVTLVQLEEFANAIQGEYPIKVQTKSLDVHLDAAGTVMEKVGFTPFGIQLHNKEKRSSVIANVDRIAVSFLAPYRRWPSLRESLSDIYAKYRSHVPQNEIVRIGMRYINRIGLPRGDANISDYLKAIPVLPQGEQLPNSYSQFETVIAIPIDRIRSNAVVRQAILPWEEGSETVPFLLDIDVYSEAHELFKDDSGLWAQFDRMRDIRNEIFLGSLTEKALEPYR